MEFGLTTTKRKIILLVSLFLFIYSISSLVSAYTNQAGCPSSCLNGCYFGPYNAAICLPGGIGASCSSVSPCASVFQCDSGVCKFPGIRMGGACSSNFLCDSGLTCANSNSQSLDVITANFQSGGGIINTYGKCLYSDGHTCTSASQCSSGTCNNGLCGSNAGSTSLNIPACTQADCLSWSECYSSGYKQCQSLPGTCMSRVPIQVACNYTSPVAVSPIGGNCGSGTTCSAGLTCANGICKNTNVGIGSTCDSNNLCSSGLTCNSGVYVSAAFPSESVCQQNNVAIGGSCGTNQLCSSGLTCNNGVCTSVTNNNQIQQIPACTQADCLSWSECYSSGYKQCQSLPGTCMSRVPIQVACNYTSPVAVSPIGGSCGNGVSCSSGLTCKTPLDSVMANYQAGGGVINSSGTCLYSDGQTCTSSGQCASGTCYNGICGSFNTTVPCVPSSCTSWGACGASIAGPGYQTCNNPPGSCNRVPLIQACTSTTNTTSSTNSTNNKSLNIPACTQADCLSWSECYSSGYKQCQSLPGTCMSRVPIQVACNSTIQLNTNININSASSGWIQTILRAFTNIFNRFGR